ncbi:MAG: hypothetical protein AB7U62_01245, partial [Pseudolabrys sp.]
INAVTAKLETVDSAYDGGAFLQIANSLFETAKSNGLPVPIVNVPGPASAFISILSQASDRPSLQMQIKTKLLDSDIGTQLVKDLSDELRAPLVAPAVGTLLKQNRKASWDALATAARTIIETQAADHFGFGAATAVLGLLLGSEKATAAPHVQQLIQGGHLATRMQEGFNQKNAAALSKLSALILLTDPAFAPPITWENIISEVPNFVIQTDIHLKEFAGLDNFDSLVDSSNANKPARTLIRAVISLRVSAQELGRLFLDRIIDKLPQYLSNIDEALKDSFIAQISAYNTFWDKLGSRALSGNVTTILYSLVHNEGAEKNKAQTFIRERLNTTTSEEWITALKTGVEPILIAIDLANTSGEVQIGANLFEALQTVAVEILSNNDPALRKRWLGATALVSQSARKTLSRNIRDKIFGGTEIADMAGLFSLGGHEFLDQGGFADEADESVRHIILPLLSEPNGVAWLANVADSLQPWIKGCISETRQALAEQVSERWNLADELGKSLLDQLRASWTLPDLANESE